MRMLHELDGYSDAVFITLTYDEDHLPGDQSVDVSELQRFFKRLRKSLGDRKIRYFAAGEYGDNTGRPHYHAIIFGLSLRFDDRPFVTNAWRLGRVHFGTVTPDSIRYVAQYVDKKFSGDLAKVVYEDSGRCPPFKVSSLGLGREYVKKHAKQLTKMAHCTVKGVVHSLPRYYLDKLPGVDREKLKLEAEFIASEAYEDITGLCLDPDVAYRVRPAAEYTKYARQQKVSMAQKDINAQARVNIKHAKRKL